MSYCRAIILTGTFIHGLPPDVSSHNESHNLTTTTQENSDMQEQQTTTQQYSDAQEQPTTTQQNSDRQELPTDRITGSLIGVVSMVCFLIFVLIIVIAVLLYKYHRKKNPGRVHGAPFSISSVAFSILSHT